MYSTLCAGVSPPYGVKKTIFQYSLPPFWTVYWFITACMAHIMTAGTGLELCEPWTLFLSPSLFHVHVTWPILLLWIFWDLVLNNDSAVQTTCPVIIATSCSATSGYRCFSGHCTELLLATRLSTNSALWQGSCHYSPTYSSLAWPCTVKTCAYNYIYICHVYNYQDRRTAWCSYHS